MSGINSELNHNTENVKGLLYQLDRADRLRSPGDDDGAALPAGSPLWFADDPFEGVGVQQELVDLEEVPPYLESYAKRGGVDWKDLDFTSKLAVSISMAERYEAEKCRAGCCGHTSAILSTDDYEDYLMPVECRKHWCPVCGGKGGKIHKRRKKNIRERIDIDNKNLRYLVYTVPLQYRELFKSKRGLNQLIKAGHENIMKFFGGKAKGAACILHLFGDPREVIPGVREASNVFHPHLNILIPENLSDKLFIDSGMLDEIKAMWLRQLRALGCVGIIVVDVHYQFKIKIKQKGHVIKYCAKPAFDADNLEACDEVTQWFLVLSLKGFHYVRYWGELSKKSESKSDEVTKEEMIEKASKLIGKRVHFRCTCKANIRLMMAEGRLEKVNDGLYRIRKQNESEVVKNGIR